MPFVDPSAPEELRAAFGVNDGVLFIRGGAFSVRADDLWRLEAGRQ